MTYKFKDSSRPARERAEDLLSHLTIDEKLRLFTSGHEAIPRLGITATHFGVEVARGLVQRDQKRETTILPQPWGMAATFDPKLMERAGAMVGDEIRISHEMTERPSSLSLFGPTVDLLRDPRWGRNEEGYSEDPYHNGAITAAYVRGLVGDHPYYLKSAPLLKHFYANNYENERFTTNASIPPRLKRDYYLKGFEPAIREGGAPGLMTAYNCINGVEAIRTAEVREICKDEWGVTMAVSDGGDFGQNISEHRSFETHAESFAAVVPYGADLMLDSPEMVHPAAKEAFEQGLITEDLIDLSLADVFELRFRLGDFDPDQDPYRHKDPALLASPEHKKIAVELAEKSMILLENDGLLPLDRDRIAKLAVVGPLSDKNYTCWYCGFAENQTSVVAGLRAYLGADRVLHDDGFDHIRLRSKGGSYVRVDDQGQLVADALVDEAEIFEFTDWDYGSCTLRSLESRKYVGEGFPDGRAAGSDPLMSCLSDEAFGWFVKEWLKFERVGDCISFTSWQDRQIAVGSDGLLRVYVPGNHFAETELFELEIVSAAADRVAELALEADAVVFCAGNNPLINAREEFDRPDINLPRAQSTLLAAAAAGSTPTVLYMVTSGPFAIVEEREMVQAVLCSSHLGPSLGHVAARTLFGENNPAGRTSTTWYRSVADLPAMDEYNISIHETTHLYFRGEALYPFGFGRSYSRFHYGDLLVHGDGAYAVGEQIRVSFDLTNESAVDGDEVVQLYVVPPPSVRKRPLKTLNAFRRVHLRAGEAVRVDLSFPVSDLGIWCTEEAAFVVDAGAYRLWVGASSEDWRLSADVVVDGRPLRGRDARRRIEAIDADDYHRVEFLSDPHDAASYVEAEDFRSFIVYEGLDLAGVSGFEAICASASGTFDLILTDNDSGALLAYVSATGTGALTRFKAVTTEIEPAVPWAGGLTNLRVGFSKQTAFKSFKFF